MGVRGLWEVVGPVARPVALESLANKRLAVDASIWIYQFLKAVRDSEGNVLKNAHIIGFFRRLCKLLYFGIKPVFVFDGEAPTLKRQTISRRNERRAGKEDDARRTAAKLLSLQMQRLAEDSKSKGKQKASVASEQPDAGDTASSQTVVYFDDIGRDQDKQTKVDIEGPNRSKKKALDPYDLPKVNTDIPLNINDTRLMTEEELAEYAEEFQSLATVGLYDTSKIDFDSPQFKQLPKATQYQFLNVARLRSRLRMGYSADQLDEMFPNRMEFSKFQVERVSQRNFLTQKILGLVGFEQDLSQRIVGEKGGSYMLKKNDVDAEGGWTLSLHKEGDVIELDGKGDRVVKEDKVSATAEEADGDGDDDDDDVWESVPIEEDTFLEPQNDKQELPTSLMNFENNVQREKLYEKIKGRQGDETPRKSKTSVIKAVSSPIVEDRSRAYVPTKEKMLNKLNKLFPSRSKELSKNDSGKSSNSMKPTVAPAPDILNKQTEAHMEDEQVDTHESEQPVEIPPWFTGEAQTDLHSPAHYAAASSSGSSQYGEEEFEEIVPLSAIDDVLAKRKRQNEDHHIDSDHESDVMEIVESEAPSKDADTLEVSSGDDLADKGTESVTTAVLQDETSSEEVSQTTDGGAGKGVAEDESEVAAELEDEEEFEVVEVSPAHTRPETPQSGSKTEELTAAERALSQEASEDAVIELDPIQKELAIQDEEFDKDEEDRLLDNMVQEVEEVERFATTLNNNVLPERSKKDYAAEIYRLRNQQLKEQRDADTVTQEMINECQELLTRFGIPYITAPYEAESQCAELMQLGLVDGIVTDDSDCFLFGGKIVYKNMFNQSKFVESYDLADIENELGLDRRMLIQLAQLLGSDYTDGLPGVGPVTAVELIADFKSGDSTLKDFTKWWGLVQQARAPVEGDTEFRKKFRKRLSKKLFLPVDFPNGQVFDAYLHPQVDSDPTPFMWGVPDLDSLRKYLVGMTGWPLEKVNDLLVPVIQDINRRLQKRTVLNQPTLGEFGIASLPTHKKLELNSSNRMKRAMTNLIKDSENKKKRKKNQKNPSAV